MISLRLGFHGAGLCAAALLAGCVGAPASGPVSPAAAARGWIQPGATSGDLLYVGQLNNDSVSVYSFPSGSFVTNLTGATSGGLCSDAKSGDVFVPDGSSGIFVYKHGGKSPIATLKDSFGSAYGCSADATTGNLAVANIFGASNGGGNVVVYANEKGTGKQYLYAGLSSYFFCGYDDKGNLFIDGRTSAGKFGFAELPSGGHSLTTVKLGKSIIFPGGVQWDGKYVAVADQLASNIYRFAVSGKTGKLEGTTKFEGWGDVPQFWIQGGYVIGGDQANYDVGIWRYPAGGNAVKVITKGIYGPGGATVSVAPKDVTPSGVEGAVKPRPPHRPRFADWL